MKHSSGITLEELAVKIEALQKAKAALIGDSRLLWEERARRLRLQETLLAGALPQLGVVLLRRAQLEEALRRERRRTRSLQARLARPRVVTWYA